MNASYETDVILNIGIALSREKDRNKLLNMILTESMKIANCDAGILYVLKEDALHFKIMKTLSMQVDKGGDGEEISLPPVPLREENVCAYAAIHKIPMNIQDVYTDQTFDFSGSHSYDKMTGYHTGSMMAVPLVNQEDEVVGVMQLINVLDEMGEIQPFAKQMERILFSLAAQAAIAVSNMQYLAEMKEQMWSFTEAMAEAIDTRTPYNANHIRKVAEYTGKMADYINMLYEKGEETEYFDEKRKEQLVMSGLLHDIGKMIIPNRIMNKETRLGYAKETVLQRFELLEAKYRILFLEQKLSKEAYEEKIRQLQELRILVQQVNKAGIVPEDRMKQMTEAFELVYESDEECIPYFTEKEKECLSIQRGTLTAQERKVMESHVELTEKILSKIHFNSYFKDCAKWAAQHHECLNGTGYPKGLTAEALPLESRMLAVADICDALLATDRPYKKPMPKEKAFEILRQMAADGAVEARLVDYMEACI